MKLSIITCTYNSSLYLQDCINSVISQNLETKDYEHIFIDAYSTDNTTILINEYMNCFSNVKLLQKEPKGIYDAMNEGLKSSVGDYILFLHGDDFLEECVLQKFIDFIEDTGFKDLYYGNLFKIKEGKKTRSHLELLRKNISSKFVLGMTNYICQPASIYSKELFNRFGYFDQGLKIVSDLDFHIKIFNGASKIYYDNYITNFREHSMSTSSGYDKRKQILELKHIRERYFKWFSRSILNIYTYLYFLIF